MAGIKKYICKS